MAISMNTGLIGPMLLDQIKNRITLNGWGGNDILAIGDGLVQFGHDLPDIAASLFRSYPGSVKMIVIGQANQPGWKPMTQGGPNGSLTVLIGLLLPAVLKCREAAINGDLRQAGMGSLKLALSPGGQIRVVNGDGKLLPAI
jgi:hypothetical protein